MRKHYCFKQIAYNMPSKLFAPVLSAVTRPVQRRGVCPRCTALQAKTPSFSQARCLSDSVAKHEERESNQVIQARWQSTPRRMTAPIRSRPKPLNNEFRVSEDPKRLDQVYRQILGVGGEKTLSEEVKWLAVTHKSYDHGRRGFNDRLSFLGMLWRSPATVHGQANS